MTGGMAFAHRPGAFKQSNKGHGTLGHKSKRSVDNVNRGRVGLKDQAGKKNRALESRKERRNKSKQVRDVKKTAVLDAKRNLGKTTVTDILHTYLSTTYTKSGRILRGATAWFHCFCFVRWCPFAF